MDMRTPLKKVRGLGTSRKGTDHFWVQRMTALALVPLTVFFFIFLIRYAGAPYAEVIAGLSNPFVATLMGLMVIAGLFHVHIGMQEIIVDYVHNDLIKFLLLMANTCFMVLIGALCLLSIVKIAFMG
ncbi:succinate dehydrogenase, hydrophobic membrane anchor protein [Martelella alba]|uniref:Succinate dehydrogenase hydrophobic membrane anchor subunit n=1 Tax=Martelella alba TaxID=2590451 RepID=A0A506UDV6_9HYPH|nr:MULTISPECIES: succinate dehydrogenase, hydrophobic membrane anchor protein [Martelella]TPW30849.1 succinate dehydrogenase, hydrophobic membrane anchor protein [Martelella alba]